MKLIYRYLFCLLVCSFSLICRGQSTVAQQLELAYQARLKSDYPTNIKHLKKAASLKDNEGSPKEHAQLFMELGKHFLVMSEFDSAKYYVDQLSQYASRSSLPVVKAYSLVTLATYYNFMDLGEPATENAQKSIEILNDHDEPSLLARANYILYGVYAGWDNLELCDKYAERAVQASILANDYELLANSYSAKAYVAELKYNQAKEAKYVDSIGHYLRLSMDVYQRYPQQVAVRSYAIANINMANAIFQYQDTKNHQVQQQIIRYVQQAKTVYEKFDRNYEIMANVNGLSAEVALLNGDTDLAQQYLLDSYENLNKADVPSYYSLSNVAQGLSDLFSQLGDDHQALFYQQKKEEYTRKEFDQTEMLQANKLEAQFENKKLLNDIQESEQKALNRRIQLILLAGVCIFLLIILILLRNSFKSKHTLQEERNLRLQQQKLDMELQAELQFVLQKEQEFRLLSEQKLLNIQMDQMQKESLADSLQIERKNRLLLRLKDKLKDLETQDNVGLIDRMIRQEMILDEKVSQSAKEFKNIHPEFFQKLKELSADKLSTLELKHCAHIHLKLSTKEIAAAFHIEPKSVRVSKYRIKQKLKLDKEVDLDQFLQSLLES